MARLSNPHKKFQFGLLFFGINEMLAQKVTTPEFDLDQIEHGEGNYKIKTAGQMNFSNITVEKLDSLNFPSFEFWVWIQSIQSVYTQTGLPPNIYKQNCQIFKYNHAGRPIASWLCDGVWPKKINGVELDRVSSDNAVETLELSIDRCQYI